jgi:ribosomal protein S27AE
MATTKTECPRCAGPILGDGFREDASPETRWVCGTCHEDQVAWERSRSGDTEADLIEAVRVAGNAVAMAHDPCRPAADADAATAIWQASIAALDAAYPDARDRRPCGPELCWDVR